MSVSLAKGQGIDLVKPDGAPGLAHVRLGLGWDASVVEKRGLFGGVRRVRREVDLDASALLVGGGKVLDVVYFGQLRSKDGALQHTGDNLTGAGDGDDESILVDLARVSPSVEHIVFTVSSYSGESFEQIDGAFVRVVDPDARDTELTRFELTGSGGPHTALVMARVSRTAKGWHFAALGTPGRGRTAHELVALVLASL